MRKATADRRFIFHANSVAFGAHIRRKDDFFVSAAASSCLPVTGGIAKSDSIPHTPDFRGIISYGTASSSAFGDYQDPRAALEFTYGNYGDNLLPTVTVVEAQITDLRMAVGDRLFRAAQISARMDSYSDRKSAPVFHSLAGALDGLSVDGVDLEVTLDWEMFGRYGTQASIREAYKCDAEFREKHADQFFTPEPSDQDWQESDEPELPESDGLVYGTIVRRLRWSGKEPRDCSLEKNSIVIEGLGSIYLGEILIQEGARRLTMLRFQLGSPDGGEGAAVDVSSNGTGWPPRLDSGT